MDFTVEVRTLDEVRPHPGADRLDVGRIGGYQTILAKGRHQAGEQVLYVPEAALLPAELVAEMGLTGRLAGPGRNRVKAIRLRGVLSEGIAHRLYDGRVADPRPGGDAWPAVLGEDYAERLGISKWEPQVPVSMQGEVETCVPRLPAYDVEAWKNDPAQISPGTACVAVEKLHGTCCLVAFSREAVRIASKGLAAKGLCFTAETDNVYTRAAAAHLDDLKTAGWPGPRAKVDAVCWVGEVCGPRIQDLAYGLPAPRLFVFELAWRDADTGRWRYLPWDEVRRRGERAGVAVAPEVTRTTAPWADEEGLARAETLATGGSLVPGADHLREGVVLRSVTEYTCPDGDRAVRKIVSGAYLTRHKGTERR